MPETKRRGTPLAQMDVVPLARPLPIAIAIHNFQPGGTERQMTELVRRLDPRRWQVHLACLRCDGAWFARAAEFAASVAEFPVTSFGHAGTFTQMREFARWCRDQRIALVHSSELYSNIFFLPAAAMAGVPVRVGSRREIAAGKSVAQIAAQRGAYAFAHRVVANAEAAASRLRREGVASSRISVVPNGLDLSRYTPRPLPSKLRRIVAVANLRPGKGHDTLIAAAPSILERFPDAHFDLIGDGTERESLERLVRERGLTAAFTFSGHVENVPERLAAADLFTLPSESEAFPNAVLEAMAAGLPIVASAVGGICEVVHQNRTGLLVPPRDPQALADALCRLMTNHTEAQALAAGGRSLVESRYSFDRMVAAIEQLYDQELSRRAPERAVESQLASL
jgi:glycosyltransferase involved in cell wall biosynthesis